MEELIKNSNETINKIEKKRPGRPRKNPVRVPKPIRGVINEPTDPSHCIEFLYNQPLVFKKIFKFLNTMPIEKIHIVFKKTEIIFYGEEHNKKTKIRVSIDCNKVTQYYCAQELDIGILCKNMELISNIADKTYNNIIFLSTHRDSQKYLQIVLKNDIGSEESFKVDLIGEYDRLDHETAFLSDDYMLKFNLPGRYFKKMISDILSFESNQATLKKDSFDDPLLLEFIKFDKKVNSIYNLNEISKLNLHSRMDEDESFRVSFYLDYIKPISSALLSDKITIMSDEEKPFLFLINMDNKVMDLRILTDIIDERENI